MKDIPASSAWEVLHCQSPCHNVQVNEKMRLVLGRLDYLASYLEEDGTPALMVFPSLETTRHIWKLTNQTPAGRWVRRYGQVEKPS